jgi:hypothetical protein
MTAGTSDRGWWLRLRARTADVPPWPAGELGLWKSRAQLERERAEKNRRANRCWLRPGRVS